jgi:hypothetical protein
MKTFLVGLWAGPGSGKSTGAAYVFSKLKLKNVNCELVTEYAKTRVWQEDFNVFQNQFYVTAKQSMAVSRLYDKVDVIITDSPVLQGAPYATDKNYYEPYCNVLKLIYDEIPHLDYFIKRVKPYNPKGRFQDETASDEKSEYIINFMKSILNKGFKTVTGDEKGYDEIVEDVIEELKRRS